MSKIRSIKRPVNKDVVTLLEQLMEQVLQGEIIGVTLLTNRVGNEYSYAAAGDMQVSEVINAFRSWEFDQRMQDWKSLNGK